MDNEQLIELTADIVSAHVTNNEVAAGDLPNLLQIVHDALAGLGKPQEEAPVKAEPVVSVRASIKPDYLVCLACGAQQKTLKRHLHTSHDMTPDDYRQAYGLPSTYPLIAANYAAKRRDIAKAIGLGRKKGERPVRKTKPKAATPKRTRTPKATPPQGA